MTLTTYTEPIRNQANQIIGVTWLDINVTAMSKHLKTPAISESGYFILLSAEGNLLVYPPDPNKAEALASYRDIVWLKPLWQTINHPQGGILETDNEYVAFQRIDGTQWILVAIVPFEVLTPSVLITLTSALLAGTLLTGVVVLFIKDLNRRLNPVIDRCRQLCKVNDSTIEAPIFLTQKTDELGILEQTVEYMAAQLTDAFNHLEARVLERTTELSETLQTLQKTQAQLIQSEKMSSLGQMVAGIAHEVNNPINFIYGNLTYTTEYVDALLSTIELYHRHYPEPNAAIQSHEAEIELDFIAQDLPKLISSMQIGTTRIQEIVLSLRNFSRLDEADLKAVDLHEGIDNTLLILAHRLQPTLDRPAIQVIKDYANLPLVECYAGLLNQVFLNLLVNAIDAFEGINQKQDGSSDTRSNTIWIQTALSDRNSIEITIADNGMGIPESIKPRLFDPFFTTKPVGKGTGLGLSISYQIITEKHNGKLYCDSPLGEGTKFFIEIPVQQSHPSCFYLRNSCQA
jgi:signal transduction histidine kinase